MFKNYVIQDLDDRFWTGKEWSENLEDAVRFDTLEDAEEEKNSVKDARYVLGVRE